MPIPSLEEIEQEKFHQLCSENFFEQRLGRNFKLRLEGTDMIFYYYKADILSISKKLSGIYARKVAEGEERVRGIDVPGVTPREMQLMLSIIVLPDWHIHHPYIKVDFLPELIKLAEHLNIYYLRIACAKCILSSRLHTEDPFLLARIFQAAYMNNSGSLLLSNVACAIIDLPVEMQKEISVYYDVHTGDVMDALNSETNSSKLQHTTMRLRKNTERFDCMKVLTIRSSPKCDSCDGKVIIALSPRFLVCKMCSNLLCRKCRHKACPKLVGYFVADFRQSTLGGVAAGVTAAQNSVKKGVSLEEILPFSGGRRRTFNKYLDEERNVDNKRRGEGEITNTLEYLDINEDEPCCSRSLNDCEEPRKRFKSINDIDLNKKRSNVDPICPWESYYEEEE